MFSILKIDDNPDRQLFDLLEQNVIGTPGKSMLYQHRNVKEKINAIQHPVFVKLCRKNTLLGTVCLSKRKVYNHKRVQTGYYIRFFTFKESLRSGRPVNKNRKTRISPVREEIGRLMEGEGLGETGPFLLYAYVDPANIRSTRIIYEFGFTRIASFDVILINRLFTAFDNRVSVAMGNDITLMKERLSRFYHREQLLSFDNLFFKGDYFVLREKGEIVCGAQAIPEEWIIKSMPGLSGTLLMHILPKIPLLRRLFSKNLTFVLIEGIYYREGGEARLDRLFSSILAHYQQHLAILCLDNRSAVHAAVKNIDPGIMQRFNRKIRMDVMVKSIDHAPVDPDSPVYISGFDIL